MRTPKPGITQQTKRAKTRQPPTSKPTPKPPAKKPEAAPKAEKVEAPAAPPVQPAPAAPLAKLALVVDDEPANRDFLVRLIQQAQFQTRGAATGAEAKEILAGLPESPMLIIIDSELPDVKGLELLKLFRQQHPNSKLIMATMLDDRALINEAFAQGCDVFMVKPHGFMELFKRIQQLEQNPTILDRLVFDSLGVRARK